MDAHGQLGIMQRTIPLGFQNQITEFIDGIASVPRLPADGDGLPVRVPSPDSRLPGKWPDPQTAQCWPTGSPAAPARVRGSVRPVPCPAGNRVEILIHAAVGNNGSGALFQTGKRLREPLGLKRLMERSCRKFRHAFGNGGNLQQFLRRTGSVSVRAFRRASSA